MKMYKKGISLIVLVITILVLSILATTVIINISNTNIINEANKAVQLYNNKQIAEAMQIDYLNEYINNDGNLSMNFFEKIELSKNKNTITDEYANELIQTGGMMGSGETFVAMDTSSVLSLELYGFSSETRAIRVALTIKKIPNLEITNIGHIATRAVLADGISPELDIKQKIVKNAKELYGLKVVLTSAVMEDVAIETDDEYLFTFGMYGIPEANYDDLMYFRGFIEYTYNGISGIMYSDILGATANEAMQIQ